MDARKLAATIARLLDEMKIEDVLVLEMTELMPLTDYFVIGTAAVTKHALSTAEFVRDEMKSQGRKSLGAEGLDDGEWVLLDYGSVVVHLFTSAHREFYDLEMLWGDAKRMTAGEWEKRGS
ncbi:MAG: ribosome silencing factor [Planctomycetota bacterium]